LQHKPTEGIAGSNNHNPPRQHQRSLLKKKTNVLGEAVRILRKKMDCQVKKWKPMIDPNQREQKALDDGKNFLSPRFIFGPGRLAGPEVLPPAACALPGLAWACCCMLLPAACLVRRPKHSIPHAALVYWRFGRLSLTTDSS